MNINLLEKLIVDSLNCKIPYFHVSEIKLKKKKLKPCEHLEFLTSIVSTIHGDEDPLIMSINSEHFKSYKITSTECCYHNVTRIHGSDDKVTISPECLAFQHKDELSKRIGWIYVKCSSGGKIIYSNVHAIITKRKELTRRVIDKKINVKKAYKVLMVGIDSMSRMTLERGMPLTHELFHSKNEWVEMKGFRRVSQTKVIEININLDFTILSDFRRNISERICHFNRQRSRQEAQKL